MRSAKSARSTVATPPRENPPRQGFFEHPEYLAVRAHLPAPWQDILDLAYYSGWRKNEILGLTWDEIDEAGGVIRLSPARSKTLVGRILPISPPIADALARRRARRDPTSPLVFHRDGIPVRRWRTAWRTACQAAGVPTRFLHDCRRTAARNLIRASVPERVAMLLTGHVLYVGWTFDFIPVVWLLRRVTRSAPPHTGSSCNNAV